SLCLLTNKSGRTMDDLAIIKEQPKCAKRAAPKWAHRPAPKWGRRPACHPGRLALDGNPSPSQNPSDNFCLVEPHVHVWTLDLDANPAEVGRLSALLCPEERERAARFHFDHHRRRFIVGRGLLRSILGEYSGVPPERVEFAYGIHGKPALSHGPQGGNLQFNLAHSEHVGMLAVTARSRIGVDVERTRTIEDLNGLAASFCSPG